MNGDKAATPGWMGVLLSIVQALVFMVFGFIFSELRNIQQIRESDMKEIRAYNLESALWRGSIDAKVNSIANDVSDIRDLKRRTGR